MNTSPSEPIFREIKTLSAFLRRTHSLANCTIQQIDFSNEHIDWNEITILNTTFLGCTLRREDQGILIERGAVIFPTATHLPYQPYRSSLYSWQELMEGYHPDHDESIDLSIYEYFIQNKFNPPINEALYQRIHDHSIDDALRNFLKYQPDGLTEQRCVGFMGGHSVLRTDHYYSLVAQTAKLVAEQGYTVASGGGPGIMEAANLGAYFKGQPDQALQEAIEILSEAPHYQDRAFIMQAKKVLEKYPQGAISLAIPTWFYGHEPSNLFASHIAKYFSNSIREDTLLAICLYGVVFAPGSAGTVQEIFMDAAQNHYGSFSYFSPMIFLGKKWYDIESMIFPMVRKLSYGKPYHDLLFLSDDPKRIVQFILNHQPIPNQ
ncbi:MAG: hypothetical protein RIG62_31120 [Cyclobacteriaceae bacterium]